MPFIAPIFEKARYPDLYAWYILASSLDIMMTYLIVWKFGGREVNGIAQQFIDLLGHWGLILLKFSTVILVVLICEVIAKRSDKAGKMLATAAIVISAMPVGLAILQIMVWLHMNLNDTAMIMISNPRSMFA